MQALVVCDPVRIDCDVGPLIDQTAQEKVLQYIDQGNILLKTKAPEYGFLCPQLF